MEDTMTKIKKYKYLGRNGILVTRILIDGAKNIPMLTLNADEGKILTNGEITTYSITVEEDEVKLWREIPDKTN
jgi:hypothetical protein